MDYWPLLDIRDALRDCDATLADVVHEIEVLQQESAGHFPPAAPDVLANLAALRELLTTVFPPAFQRAIHDEQTVFDEEGAKWEPSGY